MLFKLHQAGFQIRLAADGPSALEAVKQEPVDAALLDITMPGVSGLDVCRALREDPVTAGTAVILLTASAQEPDVQAGFRAGADDYIIKPFSPRELLSRVQAVLARSGP